MVDPDDDVATIFEGIADSSDSSMVDPDLFFIPFKN